jgi:hypothetical protein
VLVEATDFSIPIREEIGMIVDDRQIVPGEILLISPLFVTNHGGASAWVQLVIKTEQGGGLAEQTVEWSSKITIPANETVSIPVQGTSLLKSNLRNDGTTLPAPGSVEGDRLVILAERNAFFDCYCTGSESEMGTHAPDSESVV